MSRPLPTADGAGLVGCRTCARVWPKGQAACTRCGAALKSPDMASLQPVWAWLTAGFICYIPANLYPMLRTDILLSGSTQSTILGGVAVFLEHGDLFVAGVIFTASVLIPVAKFLAIAYLGFAVRRGRGDAHRYQRLYEIVEFIGRWSMIDVFVVAVLSALVQLGFVVSIHPGPAALAFALSVAFTMLSAQSFDSRLVWGADKGSDPVPIDPLPEPT